MGVEFICNRRGPLYFWTFLLLSDSPMLTQKKRPFLLSFFLLLLSQQLLLDCLLLLLLLFLLLLFRRSLESMSKSIPLLTSSTSSTRYSCIFLLLGWISLSLCSNWFSVAASKLLAFLSLPSHSPPLPPPPKKPPSIVMNFLSFEWILLFPYHSGTAVS